MVRRSTVIFTQGFWKTYRRPKMKWTRDLTKYLEKLARSSKESKVGITSNEDSQS